MFFVLMATKELMDLRMMKNEGKEEHARNEKAK
jgi:hypothetical protein